MEVTMNIRIKLILLCLIGFQSFTASSEEIIRMNTVIAEKDKYQLGLLKLALSYSDTKYNIVQSKNSLPQTKMLNELEENKLEIAWGGTSKEWEQRFLPIRIPLFKGLLGHRVFLIREGEQQRFNNVNSVNDLVKLKAGQGRSWSDVKILKDEGLPLITTHKYNNLFYMLEGGRFDYLPRSVYSPWSEMAKRPDINLEVEKNILLVYPLPAYIFVNKSNFKLKNDIEKGLLAAIEDGSFNQYFYNHPLIQDSLAKSELDSRIIIRLANQNLPAETPIADTRLWFNIDEYIAQITDENQSQEIAGVLGNE